MDRLKRQFVEIFDLPAEITMDLPLVMIVGNDKLYLENHKGISYFQTKEIKVKIGKGFIILKGEKLSINEIDSEGLTISGKILSIAYDIRMEGMGND